MNSENKNLGMLYEGNHNPDQLAEIKRRCCRDDRLIQWVTSNPDNPIAIDMMDYLEQIEDDFERSDKIWSELTELLSETKRAQEETLIKALRKLDGEGLLIRPCMQLTFKRAESYWKIGIPKGKPAFIENVKGMQYLHKLISNPSARIKCTDLEGLYKADACILGDEPVTDSRTLKNIKLKIGQLEESFRRAERRGDHEAAARFDNDKTELINYLSRSTNNKGKPRITGEHDKSRQRVKKAIDNALANIKSELPPLYDAIKPHIHTGAACFFSGASDWDI